MALSTGLKFPQRCETTCLHIVKEKASVKTLVNRQGSKLGFAGCGQLSSKEWLTSLIKLDGSVKGHVILSSLTNSALKPTSAAQRRLLQRQSSRAFSNQAVASSNVCVVTWTEPEVNNHTEIEVGIPLFERADKHEGDVASIAQFHQWACKEAAAIGDRFAVEDNGPTSAELVREVDWLLDDVVAAILIDGQPKTSITWRALSRQIKDGSTKLSTTVFLRASVEDLKQLWASRLERRVPFQYLVGAAHWRDLVLAVQQGVLIPRPETELLIDFAEEAVKADASLAQGPWADLGTGSGALAVALARALPSSAVYAVDKSAIAIEVSRQNVQRYGLQIRVAVRAGSWFEPLADFSGQLAGILSNPPYIPAENLARLQREVGGHEPRLALDGGAGEGLEAFAKICGGAGAVLRPGGFLGLETNGWGQAELVASMIERLGDFGEVRVRPDLAGVQRFVTARRRE